MEVVKVCIPDDDGVVVPPCADEVITGAVVTTTPGDGVGVPPLLAVVTAGADVTTAPGGVGVAVDEVKTFCDIPVAPDDEVLTGDDCSEPDGVTGG